MLSGSFGLANIAEILIPVALVILSSVPHEVAHGFAAYKLGDPTAREAGRLTFNPLAHIDPVGSVLLPLLMALASGGRAMMAFAKPVPYNPYRLKNPRYDEALVAAAGPICNLVQALIGALIYRLTVEPLAINAYYHGSQGAYWILFTLQTYVWVNLMLAFFNLIPLPPLDGSKLISPLLKGEARNFYYQVQRFSMPILLALIYFTPRLLGFDPISAYLNVTAGPLFDLLMGF